MLNPKNYNGTMAYAQFKLASILHAKEISRKLKFAIFKGMAIWYRIDILEEIARQIKLPEDFVAFRGVGRLWRSAASKENFRFRSSVVPWLMLPPKEKGSDVRSFFSLSKGMSRQINLPDANCNKCFSSKGWLMVIDKDWSLYLLHPFSSLRIELPHIKTFHNWEALSTFDNAFYFIYKCVLSTSPSLESEDYTLVVIHGGTRKLAYFRPGFKAWITIDSCQLIYCDVIYYQGQFYTIDVWGGITAIDIKSDNTVVAKRVVADLPLELVPLEFWMKLYLVESAGKFMVVGRRLRRVTQTYADYGTTAFRVVEVDLSRNENEWSPVKNLGNRALFVGDNSSLSVQVFDNSNFKPNCIYFTDDWLDLYFSSDYPEGVGRDMGIYNLEDGNIERIETRYMCRCKCSLYHPFNPPMWVEQSFHLTVLPKNLTLNRSGGGETLETSSSAGRNRSSGTEGSGTPNDSMLMTIKQVTRILKKYVMDLLEAYKQALKILKEADMI